jgi:hypothetical protein
MLCRQSQKQRAKKLIKKTIQLQKLKGGQFQFQMDNPFQIIEERIACMEKILSRLVSLTESQISAESEKLISPTEARNLFSPKISPSTLYRWTRDSTIKKYLVGKKVCYKKSEIEQAAKVLRTYGPKIKTSHMEMQEV